MLLLFLVFSFIRFICFLYIYFNQRCFLPENSFFIYWLYFILLSYLSVWFYISTHAASGFLQKDGTACQAIFLFICYIINNAHKKCNFPSRIYNNIPVKCNKKTVLQFPLFSPGSKTAQFSTCFHEWIFIFSINFIKTLLISWLPACMQEMHVL